MYIAAAQPCFCSHNNILAVKPQIHFRSKFLIGNERILALPFSWKSFCIREKCKKFNSESAIWQSRLMIEAVATVEPTCVTHNTEELKVVNTRGMDADARCSNSLTNEPQSSSEDPTEMDESEKLRRMRISKAIKGNTPWNKCKKHSPETRQLIKERTRLAMQDPKIKMKLASLGHAISEETKIKIGIGVRLGWEKRREKLMWQESCYHEWQNLIANAARMGVLGEEELQWDSYMTLNEQLEQEWLQSVEQRRTKRQPTASKRGPKSLEQRRKIAEAIAAKWADPEYRNRVAAGMAKYHGTADAVERKPRRKASEGGQTQKRSAPKLKVIEKDHLPKPQNKNQSQKIGLKSKRKPSYKDPFRRTKLEMLKSIRTQRATIANQTIKAIATAKLLIAEAEKAATALEIAAKSSPLAQASLAETRMLIAEAIQLIEPLTQEKDLATNQLKINFRASSNMVPHVAKDDIPPESGSSTHVVNGDRSSQSSSINTAGPNKFDILSNVLNGNSLVSCDNGLLEINGEYKKTSTESTQELQLGLKFQTDDDDDDDDDDGARPKEVTARSTTKRYVRGRLVEVEEGD